MTFTRIIISSLLLCSFACSGSKKLMYNTVEFGSGGGFTGMEKTYGFTEDGEIYSTEGFHESKSQEKIGTLNKNDIKNINKELRKVKVESLKYNKPGNLFHFIEIEKDGKTYRFVWGSGSKDAPSEIKELYSYLMQQISSYTKKE
ncbi:MAG: hypothetical protein J7604_10990 [Sporocytophaga sp.]|uniref:hypothetical protein n=1 Tax=Sporocytophaga sp. TaxID=2231183 RepID=UPI001B21A18F|nr:hypothetical protein [Sporocytophaga sp.]MBO9700724.1 hypothetical protein [Sporocytophaga sp.]